MNKALEFHDSNVKVSETKSGRLQLVFSPAMIHHSIDRPGIDKGKVYIQTLEIAVNNFKSTDATIPLGKLHDGKLYLDGISSNLLGFPALESDSIQLDLTFQDNRQISIFGESITVVELDAPIFLDFFEP